MNLAEGRRPHGVVRRRLGDGAELLLIAQPVERGGGIAVALRRRVRDRDQPLGELAPQRLVALRAGDPRQVADHADALERRAPDADVLVGGRELGDHAPMLGIVWELGHAGEPDGRIRIAILGLRLEAIEERHGEPCFNRMIAGRSPASRSSDSVSCSIPV